MHKTVAILGRQPGLGLAELESLYGSAAVMPFGKHAAMLDMEACNVAFDRLGGSVRVGTILLELPSTKWSEIEKLLVDACPDKANQVDGKLLFGISVFGLNVSGKQVARTALLMKKAIKTSGKSVRMVPHKDAQLNSAVVLHNKLHRNNNWELLVVSDGKKAYLAQTNFIQDIDAYTARDRERPMRDAKVGMLPPKLAQIIINLGSQKTDVNPVDAQMVLDPFCGTGVVLQEALLMGYQVHGSDLEQRMVDYTSKNISWLHEKIGYKGTALTIRRGDATTYQWVEANVLDSVVGETYLGQPLSTLPPSDQLSNIMQEVNALHHKFLQNIGSQLRSGTRLCLAVPTWKGKREFLHLSALDYLDDLGYTRTSFKHVSNEDLIYHREGQVVGRELLVLTKK